MKKSKYKVLALTLLLIGIPALGNVYATDENHEDWSFSFQLGRADFTQYTSSRPKLEKTPIYCEIKRINVSKALKLAAVRGYTSESTYTPITYVTKPGIYYLRSNIREDYEKWKTPSSARIRGQKYHTFGTADASGFWSPDSY